MKAHLNSITARCKIFIFLIPRTCLRGRGKNCDNIARAG